jgi:radical SAM enzyme (TIGR01210 family)
MLVTLDDQERDYPEGPAERDAWILARRGPRPALDPWAAPATLLELERTQAGDIVPMGTIFLINRECPWRCLMCDLWKNTLATTVPAGAIPAQIRQALAQWSLRPAAPSSGAASVPGPPRHLKLYNSGSFFDPRAILPAEHGEIAGLLHGHDRVIVECHPALIDDRVVRFREMLGLPLEVAMGLETIHPDVLPRLNKRMTPEHFQRAARFLQHHGIDLRVFVLFQPPFLAEKESASWALRSIDFAFDCGATVVSLIPTRDGNGAMERLSRSGIYAPPRLESFEAVVAQAQATQRGRVLADLWDLEKFSRCPACFPARRERLHRANLSQVPGAPVPCDVCPDDGSRCPASHFPPPAGALPLPPLL